MEKKSYIFSIKNEVQLFRVLTAGDYQYEKLQYDYLMEKYNFNENEDVFLLSMYDSPLKTFLYNIIDRICLVGVRLDETDVYYNFFVTKIITFEKDLIEECTDTDLTGMVSSPVVNKCTLICQIELTEKEYCKFIMLKK